MEKDGLRKQIFDEVQSQFEVKLREAKRQKTEAEEELEAASERWRTERRRLNTEIDRLESALAEAKESPRRKADGKAGIDPSEVAKMQAAAEERLRSAATEWETERGKLRSQVSRLERAVADTIERSNNPIRSTQPLREHFEARIDEATRQSTEIEQQFLRAKAEWDEEKKKLTGELIKLRRLAPPSKALEAREKIERARGRKESIEEARIRDLETRLEEANVDIQRYHQAAANAREETRNQFQPRLEEAYRERVKAEDQLAAAAHKWEAEKQQLHDQLAQLQQAVVQAKGKSSSKAHDSDLELEVEELTRAKTSLERRLAELADVEEELASATKRWNKERSQLQQEIKELQESRSSKPDKEQSEVKLQELSRAKTQAENELETQSQNWASERRKLTAETAEARLRVSALERQVKQLEAERKELEEERTKRGREQVNSEVVDQLRKQYDQKLQEMIAQKTQLATELETASATLKSERARFSEEVSKSKAALAGTSKGSADNTLIDAEVTRIEGMIKDITTLIDDPATELSTVIRKNVEKAELDAYLKGILYSLGRGKAMP